MRSDFSINSNMSSIPDRIIFLVLVFVAESVKKYKYVVLYMNGQTGVYIRRSFQKAIIGSERHRYAMIAA